MHDARSNLDEQQRRSIEGSIENKVFLQGPAGAGKTTVGVRRMLHLLERGVPAEAILVIVPQRTLAAPYYDALHSPELGPGGQVTVLTIGGLARRMVDLFWPLVAEEAGFGHPDRNPIFLTLETAQYYMARAVRPLLEQGYFDSLVIDRNRLYSQILDDLNKAAVVGFPHTEIGERLKEAWAGGETDLRRGAGVRHSLPWVLFGAQPAGLLPPDGGFHSSPLDPPPVPSLPAPPVYPSPGGQPGGGHARRSRSAAGVAAPLPVGAPDLR